MRSCLAAASTPAWSLLCLLALSPDGRSSQQVSASPAACVDLSAVAQGWLQKSHCRPSDLRREGWVLTRCSYSGYSNPRLKADIQPPSTSRCQCPLTRWLIFKVVVSNCPGAVIGIPDPVAAVGEPEFSIPVVQSEKTEYDFLRLLWGRSCLSLFWAVSYTHLTLPTSDLV